MKTLMVLVVSPLVANGGLRGSWSPGFSLVVRIKLFFSPLYLEQIKPFIELLLLLLV